MQSPISHLFSLQAIDKKDIEADPAFRDIFKGSKIPNVPMPYGYYSASHNERRTLAYLAAEMAAEIAAGKPVRIYFDDLDTVVNTNSPLAPLMDASCRAALVSLTAFENVQAAMLTERDVREAKQSFAPHPDAPDAPALNLPVIGTLESLAPDGTLSEMDFSVAAREFIGMVTGGLEQVRAAHPAMTIDRKKFGSVGIDVSGITDPEERKAALRKARSVMQNQEQSSENLVNDVPRFRLRDNRADQLEFQAVKSGKGVGLEHFGFSERRALTYLICDELGLAGPDIDPAKMITKQYQRGRVLLVRNGRDDVPMVHSGYSPNAQFANTQVIGGFLGYVASAVNRLSVQPSVKLDPGPSLG